METLNQLVELIESANNVSSVGYSRELKKWIIRYKNGLAADHIETKDLAEFLTNG